MDGVHDVRVLLDGLSFGESVRWHDGRVWVCDWATGAVTAVDPADGRAEVVHRTEGFPVSVDWLPDGRMLVLSRSLVAVGASGPAGAGSASGAGAPARRYADLSALAPGWNEIAVDGRGDVFVNEAGFDLMAGAEPAPGSVAVVTASGEVRRVAGDVWFPNGMVVGADDRTLVVAESYRNRLTAFDIGAGGSLSGRRVWADCGSGVPDGICLDASGAVWYADVPNRRCVRVAEGGAVLDVVEVDRGCFSCALGGIDGRTLYVAAQRWDGAGSMLAGPPSGVLLAVEVDVPAVDRRAAP